DDLLQRDGALLVGNRDANDVGAGGGAGVHLLDRRPRIRRQRVRHRLDGYRRIAADRDPADMDLAALTPLDVSPGTDVVHGLPIVPGFAAGPDAPGSRDRT